jgi:hypothetical protein
MKSLPLKLHYCALFLASTLLAAAPALAASAYTANLHLMSANAQLNRTLNSQKISVGQRVTAHLTMKLRTANGLVLPRNTQVLGKVSQLQSGHGKRTRVAVVFNQARLKDGKVIPIKATLLGAVPPSYESSSSYENYFSDTSKPVSSKAQMDQESGALKHIALHSAVQSRNSGIFLSKRNRIRLPAGTQLRIAIAPLQHSSTVGS